jgi:hypothetical protein
MSGNVKNKVRRNRAGNSQSKEYDRLQSSKIPRSLNGSSPFPSSMTRRLVYNEPTLILTASLLPYLVKEFKMNSAYDIDPAIGGGTVAGFNAMTHIYDQYQVVNFRIRYEVSNIELFPVSFALVFKDSQPSLAVASWTDARNLMEAAPTTGPHVVSGSAGYNVYRSPWYKIKPATVLGNPLQYNDIQYSSSVTSDPNQLVWAAIVLTCPNSTLNLTNGACVSVFIEQTVRFYSLLPKMETYSRSQYEQLVQQRASKAPTLPVKTGNARF